MTKNGLSGQVTLALVLRVSSKEIEMLAEYLASNQFNVIYQTTSYGPLYINQMKHDD